MLKKKVFQIGVTVLSLALVFFWVDVAQFVAHAQELGWLLFSIVIIATVLRMLGSGIRCLRVFNNHALTLTDAISGYTLSAYVSLFLPTAIGGDALRVVYLAKRTQEEKATAAAVVVAERAAGLVAMVLLLFMALAFLPASFLRKGIEPIGAAVVAVVIGVVVLVVLSRAHHLEKTPQWLKNFSAALQSFQNKALVLELVFWSLLTQFTAIVVPASVGYFSVGGGFELAMQLAAITPVVWLITMLPIALGGNGLREASYVAIAELLGMNTTIALTASLALTISNLLPSLVGVFIFQRFRSSHPDNLSEDS